MAPDPDDRVPRDDAVLAKLARILLDLGASDEGIRRLFRVYADNVRRLAMAEADLYIEEFEKPWAGSGLDQSELILRGADLGRQMAGPAQQTIRATPSDGAGSGSLGWGGGVGRRCVRSGRRRPANGPRRTVTFRLRRATVSLAACPPRGAVPTPGAAEPPPSAVVSAGLRCAAPAEPQS